MGEARRGRLRTLTGLVLAIMVAPVATALGFAIEGVLRGDASATSLTDLVGGTVVFVAFVLIYGTVIAAIPGLVVGGIAVAVARHLGTRSPLYFAAVGLLAALFMAWLDSRRTTGPLGMENALPFLVGGVLSGLTYWRVAER